MRFFRSLQVTLALALAAVPASAAAPVSVAVTRLSFASPAGPVVLPSAVAGLAPAPFSFPASLAPTLLPAPAQASPLMIRPAAPAAVAAARPAILQALASAPAAPGEDGTDGPLGRYADFFDGAAPASDGEAVSPRLVVEPGPTFRQPLQLDIVRSAVARALPALRESVALGGWNGPHTTLDESCCGDAAPKLALLLRAQGVPARLVEAQFHYYVLVDLPDGQIVVDPTVRQFFGKKQAPKSIPHVFAGTLSDLHAFFQRHAASKTTKYDPQRIYFRDAQVREDALRAYEANVRAGGEADHDPLRRFLGMPPVAPRPPDAPRPIIR